MKKFFLTLSAVTLTLSLAACIMLQPPVAHASVTVGSANSSSLTKGLVGYWTFDGKDITSKGFLDKSGNGGNGIFYGAATSSALTAGKVGQAVNFGPSSNSRQNGTAVRLATTTATSINTNLTITAWIKPSMAQWPSSIIGRGNPYNGAGPYVLNVSTGSGGTHTMVSLNVGDGSSNASFTSAWQTTPPIPSNQWSFVACSTDTTTIYCYLNGQFLGSGDRSSIGSTFTDGGWFSIGAGSSNSGYFDGAIDEVRIYNRVLSATEIYQLYTLGAATVAKTNAAVTLSTGLLGYWPLDGATTNWATGITRDTSGNGNNGKIINLSTTSSPVAGKFGQGLSFNGANSYVIDSSVINTPTVTVSAWVKLSATPPQNGLVAGFADGIQSPTHDKDLYIGTDRKVYFYVFDGSIKTTSAPSTQIPLNTWVFVVGTADGSVARAYVNGQEVGNIAAGNTFTSYAVPNLFISGATGNPLYGGGFMAQRVDDVRVYNRALSAAEVQQLYKLNAANVAHSNTVALSTGLVGYWTFDGSQINWATGSAKDSSGNGNSGLLINMPTSTSPVAGKVGQALLFSTSDTGSTSWLTGAGGYVQAAVPSLTSYPGISYSLWVKPKRIDAWQGLIAKRYFGSDGNEFDIELSYNIDQYTCGSWANGSYGAHSVTSITATAGKWVHVSCTLDGPNGTARIYINGVLEGSYGGVQYYSATNTSPITIGKRGQGTENTAGYFDGSLDDVRVYNRELSAAEVKQLYLMGK